MSRYPVYPTYKPTSIDWLGDIPEHWKARRLRNMVDFISRGETPNYVDHSNKKVVNQATFSKGYWDESSIRYTDKIVSRGVVNQFDVLLASTGGGVLGKTFLFEQYHPNFLYVADSHVTLIRDSKGRVDQRFIYYFLSINFSLIEVTIGQGATNQTEIQSRFLKNLKLPSPPLPEQTHIANFLDHKCRLIDKFLDKKQQLIEVLKEQKQAIINQAVTRGLDPNVKMKDSGVAWLGKIPAHWEVKKLKFITKKIGSGVTPKGGASVYTNDGIPLLRSQNIHFDRIDLSDVARINPSVHNSMKGSKVKENDVLLNITGGSIGRCFFVTDTLGEANVNQHVCIIRPTNHIITKYLYLVLSSNVGQKQVWFYQYGGGREGLNFQNLKNFDLALPPLDEQEAIINNIDTETSQIEQAISRIEKEMELIKDYRQILISEAVTGKIDVRNWRSNEESEDQISMAAEPAADYQVKRNGIDA
ncbi:restriction endonuclease subunit S [Marinoscillum furvescens]|uniref:Type I restriction enzyme S subunit n=1 Tax=Marinoscillum furvescens DSM 4134 TaxID=1122208 RepID=A0A3D9L0D1_MARFU|nr:restriction endonuclease subunit S [Marinoscillum furvescens]RED94644.1 type I restriction enzyme S subunit [Marinoscillum furvescens DSM 4134]